MFMPLLATVWSSPAIVELDTSIQQALFQALNNLQAEDIKSDLEELLGIQDTKEETVNLSRIETMRGMTTNTTEATVSLVELDADIRQALFQALTHLQADDIKRDLEELLGSHDSKEETIIALSNETVQEITTNCTEQAISIVELDADIEQALFQALSQLQADDVKKDLEELLGIYDPEEETVTPFTNETVQEISKNSTEQDVSIVEAQLLTAFTLREKSVIPLLYNSSGSLEEKNNSNATANINSR